MTTATADRTLRPVRHLAWRTTTAGNVALVVPGAIVAVVLAIGEGRPVVAGVVALAALVVAVLAILPALRIRTTLEADGLTTHWKQRFGPLRVPRSTVRRAVIRTIYNSDGVTTNRHLFLLDATDRAVYRMNDRWWTDEQLLRVAHHFDVPLDSQNQPVHLAEIRRTARQQLNWAERHRWSATVLRVAVGFLLCLAFAALTDGAL